MNLSERVEFDCPFRVHADGSVTDEHKVYAPELMDHELGSGWEFASTGYTGQYNYRGPIMHNSEQLSGRLAEDILATPGVYVLVVSTYSPEEDDDDEYVVEGWAVARLTDDTPKGN